MALIGMRVSALRGAVGFLSRLPVGRDASAWDALRHTPAAFPAAAYLIGALIALPTAIPWPAAVGAAAFPAWLYLITGINHVDGLADLGDAAVIHGDAEARRAAMRDTTVGVGAVLAVALVVLALGAAGFLLAEVTTPIEAAGLVVAAEVGAKLGMAAIATLGEATHEGLGAGFTEPSRPRDVLLPAGVAAPAAALTWPSPAGAVALVAATLAAGLTLAWARRRLGGVSGDVFGAANELGRAAALHAGVIVWTLS